MTNIINNIIRYMSSPLVQNKVLNGGGLLYLLTNLNNITIILYG